MKIAVGAYFGEEGEEGDLSEKRESDEVEMKNLKDKVNELDGNSESFASRTRSLTESINNSSSSLSSLIDSESIITDVQSGKEPEVVFEMNDDEEFEDLLAKVKELEKKISANSFEKKNYNLARYMAIFGLVGSFTSLIGGGASFVTIIYTVMRNKQVPPEVSAELAQRIRELIRQWKDETDKNYWSDLAQYVDINEKSGDALKITDQMLFMNYTIDLFPVEDGLIESQKKFKEEILKLVGLYRSNGNKTSAMYSSDIMLQWPRGVAALAAKSALTTIYYS